MVDKALARAIVHCHDPPIVFTGWDHADLINALSSLTNGFGISVTRAERLWDRCWQPLAT